MPGQTINLSENGKLHNRIVSEVRDRVQFSKNKWTDMHDKWIKAEEAALAFIPESEIDAKKRQLRDDGSPQYTTLVIPYSYAILMASHTYWTTVFLGRTPIMQYAGRHGEGEQQTQAIEALIDYQLRVGGQLVPLYLWLMDVGKYGLGIIGMYWDDRVETISEIVEEPELILGVIDTGRKKKRKVTRTVPGYSGNRIYNVRPFDWFPDPRVPAHRFQDGEFCAVYNELGWNEVLRRHEQGIYTNLNRLRAGDRGGAFEREEGSSELELPENTDMGTSLGTASLKGEGNSTDVVKLYECYIELIPKDWGLGKGVSPEKWVFTVTADWKMAIGAQPLGAYHNKFPFHVLEFEPEAYALVNRGIPDILDPIQRTVDWLINTHFYNVRKTLNDQFVVDPSKIVMRDLQDPLPGGIIRLKPAAFGTDVSQAIQQLAVTDLTRTHMTDVDTMVEMGQRVLGVNDQMLGALTQGGRRTATEVRASSTFGISRLKTVSEFFSAMGWEPYGQMLVQNSQQYYDLTRKFKIVGDLLPEAGQKFLEVSPEDIQGSYDLVPVDGTLPADRFAQANLWRELLGQLRNFPQIMMTYDIPRIFAWIAKLAGLKNIDMFKIEIGSPEQIQAQQAAGNIVPLGGPQAQGAQDLNRGGVTGQVSQAGPTG